MEGGAPLLMSREQKKEFFRRIRTIHRDCKKEPNTPNHRRSPPARRKRKSPAPPAQAVIQPQASPQQPYNPPSSPACKPESPVLAETFGQLRCLLQPRLLVCGPKSKRLQLLTKQVVDRGAAVQSCAVDATHVFLHHTVTEAVLRAVIPETHDAQLRTVEWLELSLAANRCLPVAACHAWVPFVHTEPNRT